MLLHGDHIDFRSVFASQDNAIEADGEDALRPLATCREWFGGRDDHEHILVPLDYSHHANSASFLDIPMETQVVSYLADAREILYPIIHSDAPPETKEKEDVHNHNGECRR